MHTQMMRGGRNKFQSKYNFICFINLECGTSMSGLSGSPAATSYRMLSILYFCEMCYQLLRKTLDLYDILIKKKNWSYTMLCADVVKHISSNIPFNPYLTCFAVH